MSMQTIGACIAYSATTALYFENKEHVVQRQQTARQVVFNELIWKKCWYNVAVTFLLTGQEIRVWSQIPLVLVSQKQITTKRRLNKPIDF